MKCLGRSPRRVLAPPSAEGGQFDSALAISGDTMLVGAEDAGNVDGAAYAYVRSGSRWHLQAELTDPHGAEGVSFGDAVALSGGTALIGADCADNCAGAAYAYVRSGQRWLRQASLTDPDGKPNDGFGTSLALSGPTAVIGAPGVRDNIGASYVYSRSGSRWRRQAVLSIPRRSDLSGGFGGAVALTGTGPATVALISGLSVSGIAKERNQCGSAFEFTRPAGRWHERARVADPRCSSYDEFGFALATSGATALIGAPGADDNAGAAYLLTLLPPRAARLSRAGSRHRGWHLGLAFSPITPLGGSMSSRPLRQRGTGRANDVALPPRSPVRCFPPRSRCGLRPRSRAGPLRRRREGTGQRQHPRN